MFSSGMPNLLASCPVEILMLPPAIILGRSLMPTGYDDPNFFPNFLRLETLSILIFTPFDATSSSSENEILLEVYSMFSGENPARNARFTSFEELQSILQPMLFIYLRILMFVSALQA